MRDDRCRYMIVLRHPALDGPQRVIGGSIVHDQDLEILEPVREHRIERCTDVLSMVVEGRKDADPWVPACAVGRRGSIDADRRSVITASDRLDDAGEVSLEVDQRKLRVL